MDKIKSILLNPNNMKCREQVLSRDGVPKQAGIYAWFFKQIPPDVPTDRCKVIGGKTLLYVGISPKAPSAGSSAPSSQNLFKRLRNHMSGTAEGSTLRLTLGCLLQNTLGIKLSRVGNGKTKTFAEGEQKLNSWLAENAFVTWFACEKPWDYEEQLIQDLYLPLNIQHNKEHQFYRKLKEIRSKANIASYTHQSLQNEHNLFKYSKSVDIYNCDKKDHNPIQVQEDEALKIDEAGMITFLRKCWYIPTCEGAFDGWLEGPPPTKEVELIEYGKIRAEREALLNMGPKEGAWAQLHKTTFIIGKRLLIHMAGCSYEDPYPMEAFCVGVHLNHDDEGFLKCYMCLKDIIHLDTNMNGADGMYDGSCHLRQAPEGVSMLNLGDVSTIKVISNNPEE